MLSPVMAMAYFGDLESRIGYQPMRLAKQTSVPFQCTHYLTKGALWTKEYRQHQVWLVDTGVVDQSLKYGIFCKSCLLLFFTKLLLFCFRRFIQPKYLLPEATPKPPPEPFQLEHLFGGWVVMLAGATMASIIFLAEVILKHF